MKNKFLIIGLGSMGKRRIRCLKSLDQKNVIGFDLRKDRREEVERLYNIKTIESFDKVKIDSIKAFIVSTPPDKHTYWLKKAIDFNKPAFVEASVVLEEVEEIEKHNKNKVFIAPSCTLKFHPVIKEITQIISNKVFGKITNFSYHSGQYLPDWHPWEDVNDFYVSNRLTGGGREIVPFELTWIVNSIGYPKDIKGYFEKTINTGADIEDSYAFLLKYNDKVGSVIVDVAARNAIRHLIINLELGQIIWNWDDDYFSLFDAVKKRWVKYYQPKGNAIEGYNKNLIEEMYIDEIESFIKGIEDPNAFPNSLKDDIKVLELLNKLENSDGGF